MKRERELVAVLIFGGIALGLGYWLYLKLTDPDNAPSFNDLFDYVQSYVVRGYYSVNGRLQRVLEAVGQTSDPRAIALGLIAELEEFSPKAYPDPAGQTETYSIGYGHQIVPGDGFTTSSTISQSDAQALLNSDLDVYVQCVNDAVTYQGLTPNQYAALYDFAYNEGCGAFQGSTLLRYINEGDLSDADNQFASWVYAGGQVNQGLVNRRQIEAQLFLT